MLKLVLARAEARSIAAVEARSITPLETMVDRPISVITLNRRPRISMAATLLPITLYTVQFRGEVFRSRGVYSSMLARAAWGTCLRMGV